MEQTYWQLACQSGMELCSDEVICTGGQDGRYVFAVCTNTQQTHWSYYRRPKASVLGRGVRTRVLRLQDYCTTTAPLVHPWGTPLEVEQPDYVILCNPANMGGKIIHPHMGSQHHSEWEGQGAAWKEESCICP